MPYCKYSMKNDEFKKKLSELAEWQITKPVTSAFVTADRDYVEEVWVIDKETGQEVVRGLSLASNETLPIQLNAIKAESKPCEYCDQMVTEQVISLKRFDKPKLHWRKKCSICKQAFNPLNGKFELTETDAAPCWMKYLRKR